MALFGKPRLVTLAEVASRAELLRRKRQVHRTAIRAGLGAAAAVFALLLLVWLHLTAWRALVGLLGPAGAALAVGALDLALLAGLAVFAGRSRTDAAVDEAVAVRNRALEGAMLEVQTLGGLRRTPFGVPAAAKRRARVYPPP